MQHRYLLMHSSRLPSLAVGLSPLKIRINIKVTSHEHLSSASLTIKHLACRSVGLYQVQLLFIRNHLQEPFSYTFFMFRKIRFKCRVLCNVGTCSPVLEVPSFSVIQNTYISIDSLNLIHI